MRQLLASLPLIMLFCIPANAQTPESLLEKVQQEYTNEKIYLHYDKPYYLAGETVWFKAYLMNGFFPSAKSTVFAVELLNDSGRLIDKKILPISGSTAVGEFSLPKVLAQGSYTVKAYTRNLMNFGFDRFYYHQLNIYNTSAKEIPAKKESVYEINFFPESGNMVANIKNMIAFKCTDNYGAPKDIEGRIVDANGTEQTTFKSSHDGMGTFTLTPKAGERYMAECVIGPEYKKTQALPIVVAEAVMLNISRKENKTFFTLDATTITNANLLPAYILAVQENFVAFKVPVPPDVKKLSGEIPVAQLPSGIIQLTVFNKEDKPLAERLLFNNSGDFIPRGGFGKDTINLKPREKNSFSFNLEDTTAGSFSISITTADEENSPADNIVSRFLLTSDIKGIIYNPSYYFEANDTLRQQNLDLVMLTNGWRRYSWNEILSNRFPSIAFKDPGFITMEAQVVNAATDKPFSNEEFTVIAKTSDKKVDYLSVETDSAGNFMMGGMTFEDTAKFIFQNNNKKNARISTKLLSPPLSTIFYNLRTPLPKSSLKVPGAKLLARFKENYYPNTEFEGILLDEIKLKTKVKSDREKYEEKHVSGSIGTMAQKTIDLISEPTNSSQTVFNYLQGRLSGVIITGGPLNYSVVYRNAMSLMGGPIQMNIFLDEFQVNPSQIATMRISEIAMVKVFGGSSFAGGSGGAMAIYTKRGDAAFLNTNIDRQEVSIEGFSPTKEFFSPNYNQNSDQNILNDERTTLYWNPYLITNAQNHSINFSFYNSDKAKKYKITMEGILENGKLLHIEKMIE